MSSTTDKTEHWGYPARLRASPTSSLRLEHWQWLVYILSLLISDTLATGVAFRLAYWIRFEAVLPIFKLEVEPSLAYYGRLVLLIIPGLIIIFGLVGLYHKQNLLGGTKEYDLFFRATTLGMFLVIVAGFLDPTLLIARGWLLVAWLNTVVLGITGRFTLRHIAYKLRQYGFFLVPAVIVGANQEGQVLATQLMSWTRSGLQIRAVVYASGLPDTEEFPIGTNLKPLDQLDQIVQESGIREIILATSALTREEMLSIFQKFGLCREVNLRLSSGLFEIITTGLRVKELAYVPLVSVDKVRLTGFDLFLKQSMDYFLAFLATALLSPLLLMIAIIIRFDSPGPVIHRRRVMGLNGTQFDAFKFRTMYINGDHVLQSFPELQKQLAETHKLQDDPRITRVGRILRKLSVDELPQFINVLRGEMSLVGPRMISPEEMQKYNQWGLNLLTVKPGITGLWQVSGRADVGYRERVAMDMYYIRNWNIWFDIYLLIQTIPAVLKGRGAY